MGAERMIADTISVQRALELEFRDAEAGGVAEGIIGTMRDFG